MVASDALPLDQINLIDPRIYVEGPPHDIWKRLRHEAPVFWHKPWLPENEDAPGEFRGIVGAWHLTKYADIVQVSRDPQTFMSGRGITAYEPIHPRVSPDQISHSMIETDPPRHVRLRRLINKGFTPRQVGLAEPKVRAIVTSLLDEVANRGRCDFVVDLAAKLPLAVICEMVGVPRQDWQLMFDLTNRVLGGSDPEYQDGKSVDDTVNEGRMRMLAYFIDLIGKRQGTRGDDLLSVLLDAEIDGEKLSFQDILEFCFLLIVAGNETTRNATSGGLLALCEHPDQRQRLLEHPELLPSAVEEILRWTSPVMHMSRVATRDTEIRGVPIKAGQRIVMWYPSANRDEEVFPDGDRFDIARQPNDHIAFGIGEHFCLGAGYARLELRVMFEELFRRMPDIELDGKPERLQSSFIGGIKHMPVRFTVRE